MHLRAQELGVPAKPERIGTAPKNYRFSRKEGSESANIKSRRQENMVLMSHTLGEGR